MSRMRHLLQISHRSRSLTPTGGCSPSPRGTRGGRGQRRNSLHVPAAVTPVPVPAGQGRASTRVAGRRGSAVSPTALLFQSAPTAERPSWRRSVCATPRLLVTPGSPPNELPPLLPANRPISAAIGRCDGEASMCNSATTWSVGEPPPPVEGLKFDTPERVEVAEYGLDAHPEAPVLGRGSFGTVVLGMRRDRPVAVKVMRGRQPSNGELLARRLRHPHVLAVYGVYGLNSAFSTVEMEFCGDLTLQALLDTASASLSRCAVARYASQLTSALAYCHDEGVMHLDVKPANVMVAHTGDLKLADFGSARCTGDPGAKGIGARGTVPYMAPELFCGYLATCKADVYALGICMWQMLTSEYPFCGVEAETVIYMVVARRRRPEPKVTISTGRWQDIIDRCWAQSAVERPDAAQLERLLLDLDSNGNWPPAPYQTVQ